MPFIILLVEWIYWLGSSREFNSPKEFWAIFSNLMFGSIGALMQAGPADLTPASCRKIEAMPTYFIILAFGFLGRFRNGLRGSEGKRDIGTARRARFTKMHETISRGPYIYQ